MALSSEYFFTCPYCGEQISMILDLSVRGQRYIEDCEVCCSPVQITYAVDEDEVVALEAAATEQ